MSELLPCDLEIGGKYNFKNQQDKLIYLGYNFAGDTYWHQFRKIGDERAVWCELKDRAIHMLEKTATRPRHVFVTDSFHIESNVFTELKDNKGFTLKVTKITTEETVQYLKEHKKEVVSALKFLNVAQKISGRCGILFRLSKLNVDLRPGDVAFCLGVTSTLRIELVQPVGSE